MTSATGAEIELGIAILSSQLAYNNSIVALVKATCEWRVRCREGVAPTLRSARADLKVSATSAGGAGPSAVRPRALYRTSIDKINDSGYRTAGIRSGTNDREPAGFFAESSGGGGERGSLGRGRCRWFAHSG